jgi:hypothetical protein
MTLFSIKYGLYEEVRNPSLSKTKEKRRSENYFLTAMQ